MTALRLAVTRDLDIDGHGAGDNVGDPTYLLPEVGRGHPQRGAQGPELGSPPLT